MENQNPNPVQLPPTPLPINDPNPTPPPAAQPAQQFAPAPQQWSQPQPSQPQFAQPAQPPRPSFVKGMLSRGSFSLRRYIPLAVTFVMAGGGASWFAAHAHQASQLVSHGSGISQSAAQTDLQAWRQPLEQFYAQHKFYPSDITQPTLSSLGFDVNQFPQNAPSGTSYQYVASPAGCTTQAKNCTGYTINDVDNNSGKSIASVTSTAGQL